MPIFTINLIINTSSAQFLLPDQMTLSISLGPKRQLDNTKWIHAKWKISVDNGFNIIRTIYFKNLPLVKKWLKCYIFSFTKLTYFD